MKKTYARHLERINFLKERIEVEEIWECEYEDKLKNDVFFAEFVKSQRQIRPPLNPRNALSGGRTNGIQLYYNGDAGYIDFTSLYPYVQKYCKFPIGHPQIITENFSNIENYFGLVYCRVLPPQDLFIPVLPYHSNGKLLFPLCAACSNNKCDTCNHSPIDRELEGTWVTEEMKEAIKYGYKITTIYEVWHFETTEIYNKETKSGGLFTEYVNKFLKIKQESSGYPHWAQSDQQKQLYIDDFFKNEGIISGKGSDTGKSWPKSIVEANVEFSMGKICYAV